jgi:hypothetical protein
MILLSCENVQKYIRNTKPSTVIMKDDDVENLRHWLNETVVYFPIDSIGLFGEIKPFTQSELFKKLELRLDSSGKWAKIPIDSLIQFSHKEANDFYFELTDFSADEVSFKFSILRVGIIYGVNAMEAVYSRMNFYSGSSFENKIILNVFFGEIGVTYSFSWEDRLILKSKILTNGVNDEKRNVWSDLYPDYQSIYPNKFLSTTIRDCIEVPLELLNLSFSEYERKAGDFMQGYFQKIFSTKSKLTHKAPPTVFLNGVKSFITDGYWEKTQVKIDNVQPNGNCLMVQCSITGDFIGFKTESYEESAFDKASHLESRYLEEINAKGLEIITHFRQYLLNNK